MKKIILILFVLLQASCVMAQSDNFFSSKDDYGSFRNSGGPDATQLPVLPEYGGGDQDAVPAPLGSGLLVLTALGAGYAVARRRRKEDKRY